MPTNNFLLATNDSVNLSSVNNLKNANVISISDPSDFYNDVVNVNLSETAFGYGFLTGNGGADEFDVSACNNNLVTITDLTPNDAIIFNLNNSFVNVDKATNLTSEIPSINTISEADLINVIQQKADGLYFANSAQNTYIIANGNLGETTDDIVVKCLGIHNLEGSTLADGILIYNI